MLCQRITGLLPVVVTFPAKVDFHRQAHLPDSQVPTIRARTIPMST
jgi:hypothetical protein